MSVPDNDRLELEDQGLLPSVSKNQIHPCVIFAFAVAYSHIIRPRILSSLDAFGVLYLHVAVGQLRASYHL